MEKHVHQILLKELTEISFTSNPHHQIVVVVVVYIYKNILRKISSEFLYKLSLEKYPLNFFINL